MFAETTAYDEGFELRIVPIKRICVTHAHGSLEKIKEGISLVFILPEKREANKMDLKKKKSTCTRVIRNDQQHKQNYPKRRQKLKATFS